MKQKKVIKEMKKDDKKGKEKDDKMPWMKKDKKK